MTALRVFLLVSAASVAGAILWLVMRWPPGIASHLAGAAIILSGAAAAMAPFVRTVGWTRALVAAVGTSVIGGAAELGGLYQGAFGDYVYTDAWEPSIDLPGGLTYPLLLPVVWFIILGACYSYARQRVRPAFAVIAGAILATLVDLVAEAVLTGPVGFWFWLEPTPLLGAPLLNPVYWLITGAAGCGWLAFVCGRTVPRGHEGQWMLVATLTGVAVIGGTHGEPRGLWALVLVPAILAWREPKEA